MIIYSIPSITALIIPIITSYGIIIFHLTHYIFMLIRISIYFSFYIAILIILVLIFITFGNSFSDIILLLTVITIPIYDAHFIPCCHGYNPTAWLTSIVILQR